MAIVRVYFHREPKRVAPHVRYIAGRENSRGLRGLGPAFRALNGDVERSIALLREHAAAVRTRAGQHTRDGPFVRLLFTLPDDLAGRVIATDAYLPKGSELLLRDAVEATFRSVGRHLQGVYALHFHATGRRAHPHVHVDLSPLDQHGRTVFLTARQRALFRATWEREIVNVLERAERRVRSPERSPGAAAPARSRRSDAGHGVRPSRARQRGCRRYVPTLASILLGSSGTPLVDLLTRALLARTKARLRVPLPSLTARAGLGLALPLTPACGPLRLFRPAIRVRLP
jgi:hypothetical protein